MKTAKYLFFGLIVCLTALSVLGKNNFSDGFGIFSFDEEKRVTQQEVRDLVYAELIKPLTECYVKEHPEVLMTKCPAQMHFDFDAVWGIPIENNATFSTTQVIKGKVVFDDCGQTSHVCSVQVVYEKKDIRVQESFFTDWVLADEYVKTFCKKIKKEKVEE